MDIQNNKNKTISDMTKQQAIQLFEERKVRTVWDDQEEKWYFSIVDVCGVLTDSKDALTARKYWNKLKQRLKEEGNETVTNCHQLRLKAADGKMRLTDVADTEQLFRIIQSIPSPKAEPFKQWMASHNPQPYRSLGNGSAMRCSSAGWLAQTEEECIRMATETAAPTHNHPEGIKGAVGAVLRPSNTNTIRG